jgi:hypothetical protein
MEDEEWSLVCGMKSLNRYKRGYKEELWSRDVISEIILHILAFP